MLRNVLMNLPMNRRSFLKMRYMLSFSITKFASVWDRPCCISAWVYSRLAAVINFAGTIVKMPSSANPLLYPTTLVLVTMKLAS
jgi:hypothetical protein